MRVLIVEDNDIDAGKIQACFPEAEAEVFVAKELQATRRILSETDFWPWLVVLDAVVPRRPQAFSGREFTAHLAIEIILGCSQVRKKTKPEIILVSGQEETAEWSETVVDWLRQGTIQDVLPKTAAHVGWRFFQDVLRHKADVLMRGRSLRPTIEATQEGYRQLRDWGIVTGDPAMLQVAERIRIAAGHDTSTLIQGQTGTGKELVAQAIHRLSRPGGPFIAVNLAAVPSGLFENELFGHSKGAYTGATTHQAGLFERARDGTLFLDEIDKLESNLQHKLLRVLESSEFTRVGDSQPIRHNAKLIFACQDLRKAVAAGSFSSELFYRVTRLVIRLPDLAARRGDVRRLVRHFLSRYNSRNGKHVRFAEELLDWLEELPWRGNVRELQNAVFAVAMENESMVSLSRFQACESVRTLTLNGDLPSPPPRASAAELAGPPDPASLVPSLADLMNREGRSRLAALEAWLEGRDSRDPASKHHYLVLLFLAGKPDHSSDHPTLENLLGLKWAQTDKVLRNLTEAIDPPLLLVERGGPGIASRYTLDKALLRPPQDRPPQP